MELNIVKTRIKIPDLGFIRILVVSEMVPVGA